MRTAALAFGVMSALGWSAATSESVAPTVSRSATYAPPVAVHAILERSVPAAGDTVDAAPAQLSLGFSGPIETSGAHVHLSGPEGRSWTLAVRHDVGDARSLVADVPQLPAGGYRVSWRVISADGHPVGGELVFYVRDASGSPLSAPPPSEAGSSGSHTDAGEGPHVAARLIAVRAAADLVLLPLAGLLLFVGWSSGAPTSLTLRTAWFASLAAPLLTATYAWLWAGEALGTESHRMLGLVSLTTGRALAAETALALLVPWALLLARRVVLAAVLALLAVLVGGLGGHPTSYTPLVSLPASAAHVLAAALWLGGLAFLVTERGSGGYEASARRVSAAAMVSVGVVAVTGIVQTWMMLGSIERLTSTFGVLVLAKVAGLAALIAFGAYHRLRLVPAAGSPEGATRLSSSVSRELAVASCVVVLAALLSHIPPTS